jgi:hypothetical protein
MLKLIVFPKLQTSPHSLTAYPLVLIIIYSLVPVFLLLAYTWAGVAHRMVAPWASRFFVLDRFNFVTAATTYEE